MHCARWSNGRLARVFCLFARLRYTLPVGTPVNGARATYSTGSPTHRTPDFLAPRATVAANAPHRDIASARGHLLYQIMSPSGRTWENKSEPTGAQNASQDFIIPIWTSRYQPVVVVWRYLFFVLFCRFTGFFSFPLQWHTCAPVRGQSNYFLCHIQPGTLRSPCLQSTSARPA